MGKPSSKSARRAGKQRNKPDGAVDGNAIEPDNGAGSVAQSTDIIEPASIAGSGDGDGNNGDNGGTSERKPRSDAGRRRGPRKATVEKALDLGGLSSIIFSTHAMLAGIAGSEIWKVEQFEADLLAKGIQGVSRHYEIPGVSQQTMDWINLIQCLGMIYGTRLFASRPKKTEAKPAPVAQPPQAAPPPAQAPQQQQTMQTTAPQPPAQPERPRERPRVLVQPVPGQPVIDMTNAKGG